MNRKIIWLLMLVTSVSFSHTLPASNNYAVSDKRASCLCNSNFYNKLDLTAEQKIQIKAIGDQANIQRATKQKEIIAIDNQIHELTKADQLDEIKLDKLLNHKKGLMTMLIKNKIIVRHQIYNILTAQQKDKYNQIVKESEKNRLDKLNSLQTTNVHEE